MTDKQLRKLNRSELLELLLMQSRQADEQKQKLQELEEQLKSRQLQVDQAGSIAEAAMKVNKVFEDAQAAADMYLANFSGSEEGGNTALAAVRKRAEEILDKAQEEWNATHSKCQAMEEESQKKCIAMEQAAFARCEMLERDTQQRCLALLEEAQTQIEACWEALEQDMKRA